MKNSLDLMNIDDTEKGWIRFKRKSDSKSIKSDPRTSAEADLRAKIEKLMRVQMNDAADAIRENRQPNAEEYARLLRNEMEIELEMIMRDALEAQAEEFGVEFDPTAYDKAAYEWAKEYTYAWVQGIDKGTREVIAKATTQYIAGEGMTRADLLALLVPAFGDVRADSIATTEITRAYAQAQVVYQDLMKEDGVTMRRQWHTTKQDVCPICMSLDMVIEDENGKFVSDFNGQAYDMPPDPHPRCKCGTGLTMKRGK